MDRCGTPLSDQSESPDHHTANRGGHVAGMIKVHVYSIVLYSKAQYSTVHVYN